MPPTQPRSVHAAVLGLCLGVGVQAAVLDLTPHADATTPLANPDKGWYHHYFDNGLRKYLIEDERELLDFPGMDHLYLRLAWSYLEPHEGDYRWEVIDRVIQPWTARGLGIAFRISCRETGTQPEEQRFATPRWVVEAGARGEHVYKGRVTGPEGPWEPRFDDPVFLEKLEAFLRAFGARYDGKPWLRYVDIGSIGDWGEGHTSSGSHRSYGYDVKRRHVDLHCAAFRRTQLVVSDDFVYTVPDPGERQRLHDYVVSRGISYRDDSILVDWYVKTYYATDTVRSPAYFEAVYRQRPTVLELQHYGMALRTGNWRASPGSTLAAQGDGRTGADVLRGAVRRLHATYLGYHGLARQWLRENPALTGELLNRCGYWYFLHRATLPEPLVPGAAVPLELTWENRGVAPAYRAYRLTLRLDGPQRWEQDVEAGNRSWLPGRSVTVDYGLDLPASLPAGDYRLQVRLHSPEARRDVALALDKALRDRAGFYTLGTVPVGGGRN